MKETHNEFCCTKCEGGEKYFLTKNSLEAHIEVEHVDHLSEPVAPFDINKVFHCSNSNCADIMFNKGYFISKENHSFLRHGILASNGSIPDKCKFPHHTPY